MCAVSMVGDHYRDLWKRKEWYPFNPGGTQPAPLPPWNPLPESITRDEFDELKRQVLEMKELLKRAKKYDQDNGEPDCEIDEKMVILRKIAEKVGVSLNDVIGEKNV